MYIHMCVHIVACMYSNPMNGFTSKILNTMR